MAFESINPIISPETTFPDGSKIIMEGGKESKFGGSAYKMTKGDQISISTRTLPDDRTIFVVNELREGTKSKKAAFVLNKAGTRLTRLKSADGDIFWRTAKSQDPPEAFCNIVRNIFKRKIKI